MDIGKLSKQGGIVLVHADAHCVVADKPPGLLCVPGRGEDRQDCLAVRVRSVVGDALTVHRLDMATSGLCLFARGLAMQRAFSAAFERRQVRKRYEAIVAGRPPGAAGEIDLPVGADWPNRPRQHVDRMQGRPSLTRWRVLGPGPVPGTTRVELEPVTGRSHQLRVHLQAVGHPIVGDGLYAPPEVAAAAPRLLLHAAGLQLRHPVIDSLLDWSSPAPF